MWVHAIEGRTRGLTLSQGLEAAATIHIHVVPRNAQLVSAYGVSDRLMKHHHQGIHPFIQGHTLRNHSTTTCICFAHHTAISGGPEPSFFRPRGKSLNPTSMCPRWCGGPASRVSRDQMQALTTRRHLVQCPPLCLASSFVDASTHYTSPIHISAVNRSTLEFMANPFYYRFL